MAETKRAAVFIRKDGILLNSLPHDMLGEPVTLYDDAADSLAFLRRGGYQVVVLSHQPELAFGYGSSQALDEVSTAIQTALVEYDGKVDRFFYCPHDAEGSVPLWAVPCGCAPGKPGLLEQAAERMELELADSWVISDELDLIESGRRAGCNTILVDRGHEADWHLSPLRQPHHTVYNFRVAADIVMSYGQWRLERIGRPNNARVGTNQ